MNIKLSISIKWCQFKPKRNWVYCNICIIFICNVAIEDHKPLWHITTHLSSLISLIPADGKMILLCDRLNPINSVCPIFTSPPSHTPHSPGNLTEDPLSERLEGGMLGFKSRREIRRIGTLMRFFLSGELYFSHTVLWHSWQCSHFLNILTFPSVSQSVLSFSPDSDIINLLTLSSSPSSSLMHLISTRFPSFHRAVKEIGSATTQ